MTMTPNADPAEVERFDALAREWWNPDGPFRPLHQLNPLRLAYIERHCALAGARAADVGCGGGLLAEALARAGAHVHGIDLSAGAIAAAQAHAAEQGLAIDYQVADAESFAAAHAGAFDVVTCMELLEHVPDPEELVGACARLARPGGKVFFSTLNRTTKAFWLAIVGAEYVLGWIPRGTHHYEKFIRPSELAAWARHAGLTLVDLQGIRYEPCARDFGWTDDLGVNYLACFERDA